MFIFTLIVPILMIVFGYIFGKEFPKKDKSMLAYKSKRAVLSDATWSFAHKNLGNIWFISGSIFFTLSILIMIMTKSDDMTTTIITGVIIIVSEAIVMLLEIGIIELLLKKKFDEKGKRL